MYFLPVPAHPVMHRALDEAEFKALCPGERICTKTAKSASVSAAYVPSFGGAGGLNTSRKKWALRLSGSDFSQEFLTSRADQTGG